MQRGTQSQGGLEFAWREEVIATPNPSFRRIEVRIFASAEESHSLAHLTGFVVDAPGTAR
jgi:general secretion pathway protein I